MQAQHNMVSYYSHMKAMLLDERKGITQRVGVLEASVLTQLATGDSTVLAAVLSWPSAAVETAKGTWFDAQLDGNESKELKLDENVGVLRAQGFLSTEALRYQEAAGKLVRGQCERTAARCARGDRSTAMKWRPHDTLDSAARVCHVLCVAGGHHADGSAALSKVRARRLHENEQVLPALRRAPRASRVE
jgi:hypothetical protein